MTDEQRDALLMDMHGKVEQMHGVLYLNGLVSKVERHETQLREGHLTCPVNEKMDSHLQDHRDRRYSVPVWIVILIGILGLAAPFLYKAVGAM